MAKSDVTAWTAALEGFTKESFEADGKRADAVAAARRQLAECSTDLCVVNGPAYGEGFGLLGKKGEPAHLASPPLLFDALEKFAR